MFFGVKDLSIKLGEKMILPGNRIEEKHPSNSPRGEKQRRSPLEGGAGGVKSSVSFEINEGSINLLIGPNGSGKSSFAKSVMGSKDYEVSGEIFFKDEKINDLEPEERSQRGIFLQFQNPPEIEGVNFLQFMSSFPVSGKYEKEFREYCIGEFKKFDFTDKFLDRNLNEGFSGGEKKLGEILQMIILKPDFAILDEPDSGLDKNHREKVIEVVKKMNSELGTTFLIISHYQEFGEKIEPEKVIEF